MGDCFGSARVHWVRPSLLGDVSSLRGLGVESSWKWHKTYYAICVMHSCKCMGKIVVLGEAWERDSEFECRAYEGVRLFAHWVSASIPLNILNVHRCSRLRYWSGLERRRILHLHRCASFLQDLRGLGHLRWFYVCGFEGFGDWELVEVTAHVLSGVGTISVYVEKLLWYNGRHLREG